MDIVEKANKAHASVPERLKSSPILLRKPEKHIIHSIGQNHTFSKISEDEKVYIELIGALGRYLSNADVPDGGSTLDELISDFEHREHLIEKGYKNLGFEISERDIFESDLYKSWCDGGDHGILMDIMKSGSIPLAWEESCTPRQPRMFHESLNIAKKRGFLVPEKFFEGNKETSYSESEAVYAAYMLLTGKFISWKNSELEGGRQAIVKKWNQYRSSVCQLTFQFIVPNPLIPTKTPYFLDQLWIYAHSPNHVRLIGLEIDGEYHLEEHAKNRDRERDLALEKMGYEIYHVSGWWSRIDPFRVVCNFLDASGIFPGAETYLIGYEFKSISDYVCQICGEKMVRWDDNWITLVDYYESEKIACIDCAMKSADGYFS